MVNVLLASIKKIFLDLYICNVKDLELKRFVLISLVSERFSYSLGCLVAIIIAF